MSTSSAIAAPHDPAASEPREEVEELAFFQRLGERPSVHPEKLGQTRAREFAIRFAAGALTSVVAGAVSLVFGARVGGVLLAFPAILAASLTLIEEQEDSAEAREDARGAVLGGVALATFAVVAALTLGRMNGGLALLLASVAWCTVAFLGYAVAWLRR